MKMKRRAGLGLISWRRFEEEDTASPSVSLPRSAFRCWAMLAATRYFAAVAEAASARQALPRRRRRQPRRFGYSRLRLDRIYRKSPTMPPHQTLLSAHAAIAEYATARQCRRLQHCPAMLLPRRRISMMLEYGYAAQTAALRGESRR